MKEYYLITNASPRIIDEIVTSINYVRRNEDFNEEREAHRYGRNIIASNMPIPLRINVINLQRAPLMMRLFRGLMLYESGEIIEPVSLASSSPHDYRQQKEVEAIWRFFVPHLSEDFEKIARILESKSFGARFMRNQ